MKSGIIPSPSLLALLVLSLASPCLSGCASEGCTNEYSVNYDPDADEDDGSCLLWRDEFLGSYRVNESCVSGNWEYDSVITPSTIGDNKILIANFGDFGNPAEATLTAENTFTIDWQSFVADGNSIRINEGSGSLSGSTLAFSYTATFGGDSDHCVASAYKR